MNIASHHITHSSRCLFVLSLCPCLSAVCLERANKRHLEDTRPHMYLPSQLMFLLLAMAVKILFRIPTGTGIPPSTSFNTGSSIPRRM
ncbi:uncharacterized protein H6S33_009257 [Morchella sextelata]|uniref:uncharacterized protein n=1 Tax=Morchella sextelata TaxID=1174677 RepID=UPI001D0399DF|nr:uncharacterized protein H6S33_009257 [Morchella sextelata]KAH0612877.1 hypothetical protein H6S33_009257 [Morchella sextelata]